MAIPGSNPKKYGRAAAEAGFTLVELLIGMALAGLVMVAVYTSFQMQHDTYLAQEQVVTMQQDLRASMESFAQDVRLAGYDPDREAGAGFVTANATTVRMTMNIHDNYNALNPCNAANGDNDADGVCNEPDEIGSLGSPADTDTNDTDEDVTYSLSGTNLQRSARISSGAAVQARTVAQNVRQLEFFYTLADGSTTLGPATLADIRAVEVSIMVSGGSLAKGWVAGQTFTSGSGVSWNCPTGERCRMLDVFIQCRNMGL